jgi:hypothetical protein
VPATAFARPVIDELIDRPRRQQWPTLASCPGCPPGLRPDGSLPRQNNGANP